MKTSPLAFAGAARLLRCAARLALLGVLALALGSCGGSSSSGGSAQIRVFNAIVGGGSVTVTVGSATVASGLAFEGMTVYGNVDSGNQEFKVTLSGGSSPSVDTTVAVTGGAKYSYILYGSASAPTAMLVQDVVTTAPASGQYNLRVTNAAFGNAALDVYVTAPGAALDAISPNISGVTFGTTSAFTALTSGSLQVRYTLRNSKQVIYDGGTLTFASGLSYCMVAYTKASSTLVNAALLQMDTTGSGALANSTISQFKLLHAAPGTAAINAMINGNVVYSNVPYLGITSYGPQAAGTKTLTVEAVTSPGAPIASAQPPFSPATDTSIVVTGLPGAQTALVLSDNNLPGTAGSARVRVVNVAPDLGAVDVLVNFAMKISSLGTNAASTYIELVEDTYTINFDLAGTTTVVLGMPAVAVTAGHTYTLYLVGTSGQLAGVLTRDN